MICVGRGGLPHCRGPCAVRRVKRASAGPDAAVGMEAMAPSPCPFGSKSCFSVVNATGLSFERTLQVNVAQGLINRAHAASVYVVGIDRFPGMAGIEWFPGTGCKQCVGIRERWLQTVSDTPPRRGAVSLNPETLLSLSIPFLSGAALYHSSEMHSLGPVLTACGVYDLMPATSIATLPRGLAVKFDARKRWANATAAAWFVGERLLPMCNRSTLALQAPTNLPFLADAIVMWRLPLLWMNDMCHDKAQNAALRNVLESSGHFDAAPVVQYLGWFNNTHLPNVELVCQCTGRRRLVTIASDWAENLSFLAGVMPPPGALPLSQPVDAITVAAYDPTRTYAAIIVSDGDNLAQDWSNLRPMLERRVRLRSKVPMSWSVSNRWLDFGWPVIRWMYDAVRAANDGVGGCGDAVSPSRLILCAF